MVKTIVMYKKMYYNTLDFWKEGIIMEKFLVFGHVNPDTDSVTASITLANLKRKLDINAEERVLGNINKEYGGERPLFATHDLQLEDVTIRAGESALKECSNIIAINCRFEGKYPFWHTNGFVVKNCLFTEGLHLLL